MLHILQEKNIDLASLPDSPFDNVIPAGIATKFSTPGGLKEAYLYHYPETPPSSIAKVNGWAVYEGYLTELEESIGKTMIIEIVIVMTVGVQYNVHWSLLQIS